MKSPGESATYRSLELLSNFLILNVIWIISCLPVITVYPATAAMFGVVGEWVREEERGVLRRYFTLLKRDFRQSLGIGILWTVLGFVIITGALEIRHMAPALMLPVILVTAFIGVTYLATTIFLFPVMVTYDLRWTQVIKNACLISMGFPFITILAFAVVGVAGLIIFTMPLLVIILVSVTCYAISWLCHRAFDRIQTPEQAGV